MGAASVFTICAIGPLAVNLGLHRHTMSRPRIALDVILFFSCIVMAVTGTVSVFLPNVR